MIGMRWLECPQTGCGLQIYDNAEGPQVHDMVCGFCRAIISIHSSGPPTVKHAASEGRLAWLDGLRQRGLLVPGQMPAEPDYLHAKRMQRAIERGHAYWDEWGEYHPPASQIPVAPGPQELIQQRQQASVQSRVPGPAIQQAAEPKPSKWRTASPPEEPEEVDFDEPGEGSASPFIIPPVGTQQPPKMRVYELSRIIPGARVDVVIPLLQKAGILPKGKPEHLRLSTLTPEQVQQAKKVFRAACSGEFWGRPPEEGAEQNA